MPYDYVSLQVRVWDSAAGASWEVAASSGFGQTEHGASAIYSYHIAPPGVGDTTLYLMDNLRGFTLVPEATIKSYGAENPSPHAGADPITQAHPGDVALTGQAPALDCASAMRRPCWAKSPTSARDRGMTRQ